MTNEKHKSGRRRHLLTGLGMGVTLALVTVLASGFMIETTNTDVFCITCHAMKPFRAAWTNSVHGGNNPRGVAAQCVDCHLPHGNFVQYLTAKAITGTGDVLQNLVMNTAEFDWAGNAEESRHEFTYDSACRSCHKDLTPPGLPRGGFLAHRAYLRGAAGRMCSECHPHVGHKDMIDTANQFFKTKTI